MFCSLPNFDIACQFQFWTERNLYKDHEGIYNVLGELNLLSKPKTDEI